MLVVQQGRGAQMCSLHLHLERDPSGGVEGCGRGGGWQCQRTRVRLQQSAALRRVRVGQKQAGAGGLRCGSLMHTRRQMLELVVEVA